MRRTPLLIGFSREHHGTLKLVRQLRAQPDGAALPETLDLATAIARHREALAPHFAGEEALLLPLLHQAGLPALAERLLAEHASLKQLLAAPEPATLPILADLLESHVRFEERELFPAVEALVAPPTA